MSNRDGRGRFAKGWRGGGRPRSKVLPSVKRQRAKAPSPEGPSVQEYLVAAWQALSIKQWTTIVSQAASDSEDGDSRARKWLLDLLAQAVKVLGPNEGPLLVFWNMPLLGAQPCLWCGQDSRSELGPKVMGLVLEAFPELGPRIQALQEMTPGHEELVKHFPQDAERVQRMRTVWDQATSAIERIWRRLPEVEDEGGQVVEEGSRAVEGGGLQTGAQVIAETPATAEDTSKALAGETQSAHDNQAPSPHDVDLPVPGPTPGFGSQADSEPDNVAEAPSVDARLRTRHSEALEALRRKYAAREE